MKIKLIREKTASALLRWLAIVSIGAKWLVIASICSTLWACGGGGSSEGDNNASSGGVVNNDPKPAPTPTPTTQWTYLVYMAADNSLSDAAAFNIKQMVAANSSSNVKVVVQMEQSQRYSEAAVSAYTQRGTVMNGASQLASMGRNVKMNERQSLTEFIQWGKKTYPAQRYALVLWSHGGGWKADKTARGALIDESSGTGSAMSVKNIAAAVEEAGGVDVLNFDACLMAMYEVAYEMRKAAKVMVASEDTIPGTGNPYDKILNKLVANPAQDAAALAQTMVSEYDAYYRASAKDDVTLSAIDLARMDALHAKVKEAAALATAQLATERINISAARSAAAYYTYDNNRDLIGFASAWQEKTTSAPLKAKLAELVAAARSTVLANKVLDVASDTGTRVKGSTGLAVFLPVAEKTSVSELNTYATSLSTNAAGSGASWSDFVKPWATGSTNTAGPTASGVFGYALRWDNPDVDLDLRVNEPSGFWAGPYLGTSSDNGFSSADSYYSGVLQEIYVSKDEFERGNYDVFAQYRGCRSGVTTCGATNATIYRWDVKAGDTQWVAVKTRKMMPEPELLLSGFTDLAQFITAVKTDRYGNWIYANKTVRVLQDNEKINLIPAKEPVKELANLTK
jgi:hypothetical protein